MFKLFKKKPQDHITNTPPASEQDSNSNPNPSSVQTAPLPSPQTSGLNPAKLLKPNIGFIKKISQFFRQNQKETSHTKLLEEIETTLIMADAGLEATKLILDQLKQHLKQQKNLQPEQLLETFKSILINIMQKAEQPLIIPSLSLSSDTQCLPFVILVVGVNGVGKTTTIAKLAKRLQNQGKKVILAAGDTFRAGAIEQLSLWAEQHNLPIVAQQQNADSAAVIYDCLTSAIAKKMDVVIADTAGRLHNKEDLMRELDKIIRVMRKISPDIPQEILLVLDATTGQNAINQVKTFHNLTQITGLVLTKFDGTAKGGILLHLAQTLPIPVKLIGIGEEINDLIDFNSQEFVEALFSNSEFNHTEFTSADTIDKEKPCPSLPL